MVMDNKDSAFVRVTQLREALNKVSGRIISLTTQIRQQEEFENGTLWNWNALTLQRCGRPVRWM